jgi:hypothetical protein
VRADGSTAGSRDLTGQHSCDELADAAAVVISTWQLEAVARQRLPAPPPPEVAVAPPPPEVAAAPVPVRRHWELGAGAGAGLAGAELAPAVLLVAGIAGERLGLAARAHVSGNRQAEVPAGSAAWRRALLAVGPQLQLPAGRFIASGHAGVGLSWLSVAGRGFADARRHDDLIAGLAGGLRLAWSRPGLRPWLETGLAFWPSRSVVYQEPDQRSATLPRVEILLTLGLSFGR